MTYLKNIFLSGSALPWFKSGFKLFNESYNKALNLFKIMLRQQVTPNCNPYERSVECFDSLRF